MLPISEVEADECLQFSLQFKDTLNGDTLCSYNYIACHEEQDATLNLINIPVMATLPEKPSGRG